MLYFIATCCSVLDRTVSLSGDGGWVGTRTTVGSPVENKLGKFLLLFLMISLSTSQEEK